MALVDNAWYVNGSTGVTVTDLGSNSNSSGATLTLTSVTIPAGALIVVIASEVTSGSAGICADNVNTPYSVAASGAMSGAAGFGTIFYFANAGAVSAGTITYTKQTSGRICSISAFYVTGIATSTPLDTAVTATTAVNSATPTVTGGVPTQSGNLTIGACAYSNPSARTLTNTGSFVTPFATNTGQPTASCGGGHLNVQGSLATTFTPTLAAACDNRTMIVAFKPANLTLVGWWNVTKWAASTAYNVGDLRRQNAMPNLNAERVFVCVVAGTSAATEPAWTTTAQCTRGAKFTDNTVTWQECTGIAALNGDATNTPSWTITTTPPGGVKNTAVTLGQVIKRDSGASYQICTTAGTAGNGAEPAFSNTAGTTTADNTVTWTSLGVVGNFTGWQTPFARLASSFASTWGQAGNAFYKASEHAEVQASSLTLTSPGAAATMCTVYCVTKTTVPPTSANLTTGASISTSGTSSINSAGFVYFYGVTFNNASGSGSANANLLSATGHQIFDKCQIKQNSINGGSLIALGLINNGSLIELINTTMTFSATGQNVLPKGHVRWRNTETALGGSVFPTQFFNSQFANAADVVLQGVDLSALGSGATLLASTNVPSTFLLSDCKLGASVTVAATPAAQGYSYIDLIRCDSGATNYRTERYRYEGTQTVETTIVRTGGATDGTTSISWKIAATANSKWIDPFTSLPITIWNDSTSAITTLTFYGTTTGGGVPNDDDIWAEVEYLGSSATPQGSFKTTTKADNLAASAATNNSSDGSTWAGGGAGNGFKIVVPSFTPGMKGPINITIKVAKASATYYIDPDPTIGGVKVGAKSYIVAPGVYVNELQPAVAQTQLINNSGLVQ